MESTQARKELARADRLGSTSRSTAARWYARYLVIYGIASFGLASTFGFVDPRLATAVTMPIWLVIIIGLSVWSMRQRTAIRGFGSLHGAVIGTWAAAWAITIGLGTSVFAGSWPWFVGGGVAMAIPAFVGAYVTHRRGRA
ncbi:MAG: hypothetical protein GEV07_08600 [Streptosporangiales bacterium]|nr:hypothetical protein [Streptosporangiales bacterium]